MIPSSLKMLEPGQWLSGFKLEEYRHEVYRVGKGRLYIQYNGMHHYDTEQNVTQHNVAQYYDTQHATQQNDRGYFDAQYDI